MYHIEWNVYIFFNIDSRVKQSDPLLSSLFGLFINDLNKYINGEHCDVNAGIDTFSLLFDTDDIVLSPFRNIFWMVRSNGVYNGKCT